MNQGKVLCKIDTSPNGEVLGFVCQGLGDKPFEYMPCLCFGVWLDDKLIAGIVLNDIRPYRDDGQDCFVYGMLKQECKWSNNNE